MKAKKQIKPNTRTSSNNMLIRTDYVPMPKGLQKKLEKILKVN